LPVRSMSDRMPPDQVGEGERAARSWQANRIKR
jgi:hypothetical protein